MRVTCLFTADYAAWPVGLLFCSPARCVGDPAIRKRDFSTLLLMRPVREAVVLGASGGGCGLRLDPEVIFQAALGSQPDEVAQFGVHESILVWHVE